MWQAVATREGQAGWSPDPYAEAAGDSLVEEPPSRFVIRTPTEPNGAFHNFEYLINPRANGSTLYLHGLKQYLSHFAGRPAVFVTAQAPEHANTHQAWSKFEEALGLPDGTPALTVGDEIRLTPIGLPAIESVVDYVEPGEDFLALRSTNGLYRFHSLERLGMSIAIGHYIYLNNDETVSDRDRHDLEQQWQSWVDGISERAK